MTRIKLFQALQGEKMPVNHGSLWCLFSPFPFTRDVLLTPGGAMKCSEAPTEGSRLHCSVGSELVARPEELYGAGDGERGPCFLLAQTPSPETRGFFSTSFSVLSGYLLGRTKETLQQLAAPGCDLERSQHQMQLPVMAEHVTALCPWG